MSVSRDLSKCATG